MAFILILYQKLRLRNDTTKTLSLQFTNDIKMQNYNLFRM